MEQKEIMLSTNRHHILITENGNILVEVMPIDELKWKTLFCFWDIDGDIDKMEEAIKYFRLHQRLGV